MLISMKYRYMGGSGLLVSRLTLGTMTFGAPDWGCDKLTAGQYLYNLVHREPEREIVPAAVDSGVGIFCYSPLGGGLLTGKYKNQEKPEDGSRLSYRTKVDGPRFWHPKGFETAAVVEAVSGETDIPMPKLAIGWPLRRPFVTSVILGVRTTAQLAENMEHGDWDLPEDVWEKLEEKTRPSEDYLSWFNKMNYERHFSAAEHSSRFHELP